jgi:hypothetical protein
MPFEHLAENRIREALKQGAFDHLPGAGRPLDLEEYFKTPEDRRMVYSILKNARCVPTEVDLLNDIARLESVLADTTDDGARAPIHHALNDRRTELAVLIERKSR